MVGRSRLCGTERKPPRTTTWTRYLQRPGRAGRSSRRDFRREDAEHEERRFYKGEWCAEKAAKDRLIHLWFIDQYKPNFRTKSGLIPSISYGLTKYRRKVLVGSVAEDLHWLHELIALWKASWTEKSTLEWSSVESFVLCRNMRRWYQRGNRTICGDAKGEISQWEYSDIDSKRLLHRRQYDLAIQDWRYQIQVASTNWRGCQEANHSEIWI